MLPKPRRAVEGRRRFTLPIALYGTEAVLCLPENMTEAEARKIASVVLAYGKITPFMDNRA